MQVQLKAGTFLSLEEVKDWLKIKPTETSSDSALIRMINSATNLVEKYIDGPVLTRQFTEQRDGNSSNVIVPSFYPVREVVEVRIDYNRDFTDLTKLPDNTFVLRGSPSLRQVPQDSVKADSESTTETHYGINPRLEINGSDIVLRDDNSTAILGRIFAGSVVQSILLTYTAGWGATPADIPDDIIQATMMTVEYYYMLREMRDQGIKSRTNFGGQSYTRDNVPESGIPPQAEAMLDKYVDYSLGISDVPQSNTFVI